MPTQPSAPRHITLTLIAAAAENGTIGNNGDLPWHLPDDLAHFKRLTLGHTIIMGRKTWETLPAPLPKRRTIVLTRQEAFNAQGAETAHNLDEALALCEAEGSADIVGGGAVYRLFLPLAHAIELTRVHAAYPGDATFPAIDAREWSLVSQTHHPKDERHDNDFTFERWERTAPTSSARTGAGE